MVMDTRKCNKVELGRSCTASCGDGFIGDSKFECQTDGVSLVIACS